MGPRAASPSLSRVSWGPRVAAIADDSGEAVFEQEVEAPEHWSDAAVGIVASRYFGGRHGSPEREKSVRDLVKRIAGTLAGWVREQGLGEKGVEERLSELLVWQRGAFNSPVWFNVGIDDHPQCSACFILSVED
ncbi:MAG: vitamin B12-dependent ribonucleotide reductase, partial [Planctomycetota bacterium]